MTEAAALPLFAAASGPAAAPPEKADPLRIALAALDLDRLTPREAQAEMYRLQALMTVAGDGDPIA